MNLINIEETKKAEVDVLAEGFIAEVNQYYQNLREGSEDAVQRFWFRNKDQDGNPVAEPVEGGTDYPTGPEILTAMGTNAQKVLLAAHARVELVINVATALGATDEFDATKFEVPFDLVWNADGSLQSATKKA